MQWYSIQLKTMPLEKIAIYMGGLFLSATGVALSAKASIGIGAGNTLPYIVSEILGQSFGVMGSIFLIMLGLCMFVGVDLMPMPVEGIALALSQRLHRPFSEMKMLVDCLGVGMGIVLSLLCLGQVIGVGMATVVAAILVGKLAPYVCLFLPTHLRGAFGKH